MKVAIITCYKQPDYVRAVTLRAAAAKSPANQLFIIKNNSTGFFRYLEVLYKVVALRVRHRPDIYLITFRGYEIMPALNILTWPKPLIFDEFINPLEWLQEPRPEWWAPLVPFRLLRTLYRIFLRRSSFILADTEAHALYSEQLTYGKRSPGKYVALPVSTDETIFKPQVGAKNSKKRFEVFFYGNMIPLHGLKHVLEAAVILKKSPIEFIIVGGKSDMEAAVHAATAKGARISYQSWVPFAELPDKIHQAGLCLGGPFGDTTQASMVVTGKTYQFLACGAPTLIGDVPASAMFIDRRNCLKVPLGDAKALANAVRWASTHPSELARIGKYGRTLYKKEFAVSVIAPQLNALLREAGA